ncbi:hypothetical protein B9Z19DRAFT_1073018 [Tuber borchii]|uniref:Uncharacterized protein n=1 Tax=Tuber borchii TaxID=42251 RepID=A0A2T7A6D9_TUBBO|nr:hypothetical protein B9Z19DRAFT_1073018 [Tuber borchii]
MPFQPCTVKNPIIPLASSLSPQDMYNSRKRMPLREAFLFPSLLHAFLVPLPKAMIDN